MRTSSRVLAAAACLLVLTVAALVPTVSLSGARTDPAVPLHTGVPIVATTTRGPVVPGLPSALQRDAAALALPFDPIAYAAAKARARGRAGLASPSAAAPGSRQPATQRTWQGIDPNAAPSDSTGAIGRTRYVELVNSRFALYDRSNDTALATGSLNQLAGVGSGDSVFDPQVIWDPKTERFYFAMVDAVSAFSNFLAIGYSRTATPSGSADWCRQYVNFGSEVPDYPKLGQSSDLIVIGANIFPVVGPVRTDLVTLFKPPSGTSCVTLTGSTRKDLRNADGTVAWTPMPANDIEGNPSNYTLATASDGGNFISIFQVVNFGSILFVGPKTLTVPHYDVPANAPQPPPAQKPLDTLDGRIWTAVEAIDPSRGAKALAIWTAHTVLGGAGAEVRWYEINPEPATPVPYQSGSQTSTSVFVFNQAIAPDRRASGADRRFGDAMALAFNTSSATQPVDIRMVSKIGANAQTQPVVVKTSAGPINDGACTDPDHPAICRWGDYSAATPDPSSDTGQSHGVIWFTSSFASSTHSRTWNWSAMPK
jgi:hypothetical protein